MKFRGRNIKSNREVELVFKNLSCAPRVVFNILRSKMLIDYKVFSDGFSFLPSTVVWEITSRCNLRCKMCWLWGENGIGKDFVKDELDIEGIKKIIDDLSSFKPIVYITGGEPFIRKDMMEIIDYIKDKGMICTLTTNGTLIDDKLAKSLSDKLDVISFSLDGTKEIHNEIRGKGVFEKCVRGIKAVLKERKSFPIIKINTTLSDLNYDSISKMVLLADELGVDEIQFQHLWFLDEKYADAHKKVIKKIFGITTKGIDGYILGTSKINIDILYNEILKIKNLETNVNISFYPDINTREELKRYYTDLSFHFRDRCVNPWFSATIRSNGDVTPCPDYYIPEYVIGNLKNNFFSKIWNSEQAKKFRLTLREKGYFPGCIRCCGLFG
ncbi:MAG TPA: radical SAM protein [Candidatus Atribacteria bacterium]|nr:radical SAM protein [Candidatus Atribacteria bacterium]